MGTEGNGVSTGFTSLVNTCRACDMVLNIGPRSLKSGTAATMVGGPKEIGGTKGCNCIYEGGAHRVSLYS